jgi:hypothetical protein
MGLTGSTRVIGLPPAPSHPHTLLTAAYCLVQSWCARLGRAPRELMMALSFSAMIGGAMTVIGSPANLLLNGLVMGHDPALVRVQPPTPFPPRPRGWAGDGVACRVCRVCGGTCAACAAVCLGCQPPLGACTVADSAACTAMPGVTRCFSAVAHCPRLGCASRCVRRLRRSRRWTS